MLSASLLTAVSSVAQTSSVFTKQPTGALAPLGSYAEFSFSVQVPQAFANLGIVCFKSGTNVSSRFAITSQSIGNAIATSGNYTTGEFTVRISNIAAGDVGSYTFEVTVNNIRFSDTISQPATLTIGSPSAPQITTQPQSITLAWLEGGGTVSVQASGVPAPTYQWFKNGVAVSGATKAAYSPSFFGAVADDAGAFNVVVSNGVGSVTSSTAFVNVSSSSGPWITAQPQSVDSLAGQSASFSVALQSTLFATKYQWFSNSAVIPGATNQTYVVPSVSASNAGAFSVMVINTFGSAVSNPATLRIVSAIAPLFTSQPSSVTIVSGQAINLSTAASGLPVPMFQWSKNGSPILDATSPTLSIAAAQLSDAGSYTVSASNTAGVVTSSTAVVSVTQTSRLINLSVLTDIAAPGDSFTLGYVVGGSGTKPLVIRAAGPSLGALGVPGTLADPKLETFAGSNKTGENDNWGGSAQLTTALAAVGAFAYTGPTSRDAAVAANITTRDNSVVVSGVGSGTGAVIAEIYDATPAASFTTSTPRLLNVSVRKHLAPGLTVGFVLGSGSPTKVLIRAVGPGLAAFGVPDTVVDPQLTLFNSSSVKIGENNDWAGGATLTAAFASVGAFVLPAGTSKDAALLVTLPPGGYSVQVSGVGGTTGTALVEVYEVP